jgi:hypothetical protein
VNKQFLTFLFFLMLSGIFWLTITFNETYESELKVPVRVVGIPKNVMLTSPATDTVRAMVRDKGWMIVSYLYGDRTPTINLNYKNYDRGNGGGMTSASELKRLVEQTLESTSKVTAIKPERLEFFYNNGERKRVPVQWTGRVIPEQLYFISQVAYKPDSVDVYASKEKLDSIRYVYSEPLNYVGFHDTLTVSCRLAHDTDVKVMPEHISISFFTDVLTEENISVPIQCINLPKGKVLRTFPAKVKVNFVAGAAQIRTLNPEEFVVVADYAEIMEKPSEKCNLYLNTVPQGISRAKLSTKQVDYLIEEEEGN